MVIKELKIITTSVIKYEQIQSTFIFHLLFVAISKLFETRGDRKLILQWTVIGYAIVSGKTKSITQDERVCQCCLKQATNPLQKR
jgi:hypothetical protein